MTDDLDPNVYVWYSDLTGVTQQFVGNTNLVNVIPAGVVYSDQDTLTQYFVPYSRILMIRTKFGNTNWG